MKSVEVLSFIGKLSKEYNFGMLTTFIYWAEYKNVWSDCFIGFIKENKYTKNSSKHNSAEESSFFLQYLQYNFGATIHTWFLHKKFFLGQDIKFPTTFYYFQL